VLLLDTHVWIWSANGETSRVGPRSRSLLLKAEAREAIRVSPVTMFELSALHTSGRLRLARPLEQWVRDSLAAAGVRVAELTSSVAMDAGSIPRAALADPLDRLLVSTARHLDATLVTADRQILEYASQTGNVRVHDASL
jgi:PIN domain nuclease of toxin-antitoxin system